MERFPMFYCYKLHELNDLLTLKVSLSILMGNCCRIISLEGQAPLCWMFIRYLMVSLCVYKYVYMGANSCV